MPDGVLSSNEIVLTWATKGCNMPSLIRKKKTDTSVVLRVRISHELSEAIKETEKQAREKGFDFVLSEVVESALRRAVESARKDLGK